MSGNNNVTVAFPGHDNWSIWWTWNNHGLGNFQLDIVGFLAVLGEESVSANAQVSALSRLFYLPRIMPAPQALLRTTRPISLHTAPGTVTAVESGNVKDHVHHVASILLDVDLPKHTVRCVEVRKNYAERPITRVDNIFGGLQRSNTGEPTPIPVKAKTTGPQTWVALTGTLLTVILLVTSCVFGDGMSLVATLLLSLLSTVVGICNKWNIQLPKRLGTTKPPKGDVVIRYPNGSYLVVRCDETVARELYFAPEEIEYHIKESGVYRMLALLGTLMLMMGVIALANAKLQLQVAWAGAFIIINIAHWVSAALPQRLHWDLSCYTVIEEGIEGGPENKNFTEALWKAIMLTKDIKWVRLGKAAPDTPVWKQWLEVALEQAMQCESEDGNYEQGNRRWRPKSGTSTIWVPPKFDAKGTWDSLQKDFDLEEARKVKTVTSEKDSAHVHQESLNDGSTTSS